MFLKVNYFHKNVSSMSVRRNGEIYWSQAIYEQHKGHV